MLRPDFLRVLVFASLILAGSIGCAASGSAAVTLPVAEARAPAAVASERVPYHAPVDRLAIVRAESDATTALRAVHGDLLRCYEQRLATSAAAHTSLVVEIVIDPSGGVRRVDTTGGARLGARALHCIRTVIARASFAADPTGGTSRVRVPLDFDMLDG